MTTLCHGFGCSGRASDRSNVGDLRAVTRTGEHRRASVRRRIAWPGNA